MAQTVIGSSMVINGEITAEESLVIQGTVKGKVTAKEALAVERSGVIEADVDASAVTVTGQIKGNVTASEKLELNNEGRVVGDVKTPRIHIADGATFRGRVDMDV